MISFNFEVCALLGCYVA